MTRLTVTPQGSPATMDQEYRYPAPGGNNGRIAQMKDWVTGEEVNYTYDSLNRMTQASTTGPEYGLNYTYDGFGNMTSQTLFKGSGPTTNLTYDAARSDR